MTASGVHIKHVTLQRPDVASYMKVTSFSGAHVPFDGVLTCTWVLCSKITTVECPPSKGPHERKRVTCGISSALFFVQTMGYTVHHIYNHPGVDRIRNSSMFFSTHLFLFLIPFPSPIPFLPLPAPFPLSILTLFILVFWSFSSLSSLFSCFCFSLSLSLSLLSGQLLSIPGSFFWWRQFPAFAWH